MKTPAIYTETQNRLLAKLDRLKAIETGFNQKGWANLSKKVSFDLNRVYDLQNEIEDRLRANWSDFKDWHWDQFGFNTYP